jgi:hypothetical protein
VFDRAGWQGAFSVPASHQVFFFFLGLPVCAANGLRQMKQSRTPLLFWHQTISCSLGFSGSHLPLETIDPSAGFRQCTDTVSLPGHTWPNQDWSKHEAFSLGLFPVLPLFLLLGCHFSSSFHVLVDTKWFELSPGYARHVLSCHAITRHSVAFSVSDAPLVEKKRWILYCVRLDLTWDERRGVGPFFLTFAVVRPPSSPAVQVHAASRPTTKPDPSLY